MRGSILKTGAMVAGLAIVGALPAVAQQATPVRQASAQPAASSGLDDPTIAAIFDAANTWDMETGALAARKGSTAAVRDFGKMLVRDHRAVRQQGRDLVARLNAHGQAPKDFALAKAHADAMARLRAAKGADFDKVFLENEVAFHKAVLDAVTGTLLPATKSPELRDLQTRVAPAFQAHMMAAQNMLDKQSK